MSRTLPGTSAAGWSRSISSFAETLRQHGVIPFVQIDPTDASISAIAAGTYDPYLQQYAESVRDFGHPVVIGFGHEMNATLVHMGLRARRAGHVHSRLAAHSDGIPPAGRGQRDLVVDHSGRGPRHRTGPGLVARRAVRDLGRHRQFLLPSVAKLRDRLRPHHQPGAVVYRQAGAAIGDGGWARSRVSSQDPRIYSAGWHAAKTLGLVWFDIAQHGGTYHQDWRIEDSPLAEPSFQLGVSQHLAPLVGAR